MTPKDDHAGLIVMATRGQPMTSSLIIARKFGKRHDRVLRAIDNLECPIDFRLRNFGETSNPVLMPNGGTRNERCFNITRDGFAFLAMGFTGKKAAEWKIKFLDAFNWQAREINRLRALHHQPDWQAARIDGKAARRDETDVIKSFVDYAKSQGSKRAGKYYLAITRGTNRALFFVESAVGKGFRDRLTSAQLAAVAMAERIVERALLEAMNGRMYYRDAFRMASDRVRQFSRFIGRSVPGQTVSLLENAPPDGSRAGRAGKQTDKANHIPLGAGIIDLLAHRQSGRIDACLAAHLAFLAVAVLLLAIKG